MIGSENIDKTAQPEKSILRLLLGVASVVIILGGMRTAKGTVNQVLLALLLTLLFIPVYHWLQKRGLKPWLALTVVVLFVLVLGVGLFLLFGVSVAQIATEIPNYQQGFDVQNGQLAQFFAERGIDVSVLTSTASNAVKWFFALIAGMAVGVVNLLIFAVFVLLIFGYMLAETSGFSARLRAGVAVDSPAYIRASESVSSVVSYMAILAVINLIIAVLDVIFLWVVGIPHAMLWGVIAFVFGFIPFIGYWISIFPPLILGFSQGGVVGAIIIIFGYWLINGVISQGVAPRFYGKGLNLSPTVTLIAVLFWGWLLGPIGAIVGVPLTAILRSMLLGNYPETHWLALALSAGGDDSSTDDPGV
jgi:predicted PurR-regulated permease PerM